MRQGRGYYPYLNMFKCNVCDYDKRPEYLYKIDRFDDLFHIVKCPRCRLIYQHPQLEQNHYDEGYYKGKNTYSYVDEREDMVIRDIENDRRVQNIKKFLDTGERRPDLLDIGCSFGALTRSAIRNGFNALGVDTSPYISTLRKNDPIFQSRDIEHGPIGQFDAITMVETVEHLTNPRVTLLHCHQSLRKDGMLVLQTTNMDSTVRKQEGINSGYILPGHTYYFSVRTITKLLKRTGFKVEKIYYGHETGLVTALIRKMLTNLKRHKFNDWQCFAYTLCTHILSKLHLGHLAVHNGMVVYARRVD